jgi:hypothetical protein
MLELASSLVSHPFREASARAVAYIRPPDTIWNHMAGIDSGTGIGGSSFTHYVYDGTYQWQVR